MSLHVHLAPHHRVYAGFALYSFGLGSIFPRLPDIQAAMGVEEGALGLGLIGTPVGTLVSLTFAAPLLEKLGYRTALLALIPLMALGYAVASHASNPFALFLLLIPVGLMVGSIEIILNLEADRAEHLLGRRIMNRAHAFWSIGFFAAGLAGAGFAQLGVSPQNHLALIVLVAVLGTVVLLGSYTPSPQRPGGSTDAAPRFARPTGAIMVLVVITLSALLLEGASMDWSAIYMRDVFATGPFLSGFAVAVFAFAQALMRFYADPIVDRFAPAGVARALIGIMGLGVIVVFFSPSPVVSLVGFAMLGVGSSAIFPLAMSAAAQRTDRSAAINVATLAQISFVMFLLGPPLLGFVAEHWGLKWAFGLGLPLVVASFIMAPALGTKQAEARVAPAE